MVASCDGVITTYACLELAIPSSAPCMRLFSFHRPSSYRILVSLQSFLQQLRTCLSDGFAWDVILALARYTATASDNTKGRTMLSASLHALKVALGMILDKVSVLLLEIYFQAPETLVDSQILSFLIVLNRFVGLCY